MHNYFKFYINAVTNPLPEMKEYFDKENEYLKDLVNRQSVIFDVGCGNGRNLKFLSPFVKKAVGIDYDSKMIRASKKNLKGIQNIELIAGDFLKDKIKDKFDLVYAPYNLLGSTEVGPDDRLPLINRMIGLANPGGRVVLAVWSDVGIDFALKYYPSIGIDVVKIAGLDAVTSLGIFKRFTKKELEDLANETKKKFKIIELTKIFYLLDIQV